jgi:DMSO/TMAO reductase YedYZ molybdopterin-dependent catalytic subunit
MLDLSLNPGTFTMANCLSSSWRTQPFDRRTFLRGTAAALPMACTPLHHTGLLAAEVESKDSSRAASLITRQQEPKNLESPFAALSSFVTPNDLFYVRNHFPMPKLDVRTWRLKVEGAVSKERALTYDQLRVMPARTVTATLECAGNNRAYLTPKAKGVQWELGAVSNAEWTGVPLAWLLEDSGVKKGAVEVVLEGADKGEVTDQKPLAELHFARSLPLARAHRDEVILAYKMNGKELPAEHGFPLRVVVPGWYGVASIKWLRRLVVTDRPFNGFFQTFDYSTFERARGLTRVVPITELEVKAQIARPTAGEAIKAGSTYRVHGVAWTGDSVVSRVEVSTDGGSTWNKARLLGKPVAHAWRLWEYSWEVPGKAGMVKLLARAADERGRVQPLERDVSRRNYMISHVLPVEVAIKG